MRTPPDSSGGSIAVSITGPRIAATVSGARSSIATVRDENGRPSSMVSPLRQRRVNLAKLPRSALTCAVLAIHRNPGGLLQPARECAATA